MGVDALWRFVIDRCDEVVDVKQRFGGQIIAHDASPMLVAAALQDPRAAVEQRMTEPMRAHVRRYIAAWQGAQTKLFFVADGRRLPAKLATGDRRDVRALHLTLARAHDAAGRKEQADTEYKRAGASIPPALSVWLRELCAKDGHGFVVAPYEADFQLIELVRRGVAVAAFSGGSSMLKGDSDLVTIAQGDESILQSEYSAGNARLVQPGRHVLGHSFTVSRKFELDFTQWDEAGLRFFCAAVGNDFCKSPIDVGLATTYRVFLAAAGNLPRAPAPALAATRVPVDRCRRPLRRAAVCALLQQGRQEEAAERGSPPAIPQETNVARLLWTHGPVWRVELEPGSLKLSSVAESHLTPLPDAATLAQLYAGVQLSEVAPPLGAELPTTERRLAYARGDVHPKTLEPWTFGYIPPVPAPAPAAAPSIPTTGDDDELIVKIPDVDEDSAKTTNKALLDFCAAHDIPVPFSTTGKEGRERLVEHVKNIKYRLKTWPDETIVGKLAYTPATHGYRKPVVGAQEWHRKVPLSDELHKLVQQLPIDNALIDRYCSLPGVLKRSKMWWRDGKCQTMGLLADVGTWLEPSGTRYDVIALRMITWASQESENGKPVEHNNTVGFIRRAGSGEPFDLWVRLFSCCVSSLPCAHGLCTLTAAWELKTAASAARYRETVKQPLPPPHGSMVVRLDDCVVLQQGPGSQRKRKGNVVADEEAKDYLGERHLESMQQKDVLESSGKVDTEMESLRHGWGGRRANSGRKSLPLSERSEGSDAHRMAEHRAALRAAAPAAAPAAATGVVSLPDDERFGEPSMVRMLDDSAARRCAASITRGGRSGRTSPISLFAVLAMERPPSHRHAPRRHRRH